MFIHLIWKSIFSSDTTPSQSLSIINAQGIVTEAIGPNATGRVQLHGVSWLARCADQQVYSLPVDTPVQVVARAGLILLIRPRAASATAVHTVSTEAGIRPIGCHLAA